MGHSKLQHHLLLGRLPSRRMDHRPRDGCRTDARRFYVGEVKLVSRLLSRTPEEVVRTLAARLPLVRNAKVVTETIPGEGANPSSEALVLQYELKGSCCILRKDAQGIYN